MAIKKYQEIKFTRSFDFGTRHSGRIEFGMRYMYLNREPYAQPYFVIRGFTEYRLCHDPLRWISDPDGVSSEEILTREPKVADLIQFNLWLQEGLPDNYIEHSMWYYKTFRNWFRDRSSEEDRAEYWLRFSKNTLLYEGGEAIPNMTNPEELPLLESWLRRRETFLKTKFHETMKRHGIEYITEEEMQREGYVPPLRSKA